MIGMVISLLISVIFLVAALVIEMWIRKKLQTEIELLRKRNERLERLFDLQWKRTREAGELWRQAHPGNELTSPDLGELVQWLMDRANTAEAKVKGGETC